MSSWRSRVVQEALSWDRTPYHHGARIKGVGVDCAMLLAEVYQTVGLVPHLDPGDYTMDWASHRDEERIREWADRYATQLPDGQLPEPGDLVLYRFGRCFSHAAIVIEWPTVIHAVRLARQVLIEDGNQGDYAAGRRPRVFYTLNEVI